jgi:hypothetical protein
MKSRKNKVNKIIKWSLSLVTSTLIAGSFGCRSESPTDDKDTSAAKTLDNFTSSEGAELTASDCGLVMTEARFAKLSVRDKRKIESVIAPTEALKRQVAGALVAVPRPLQKIFFAAKGKIRVSSDSARLCRQANLSESEREYAGENTGEVTSCWKNTGTLEIILKDDPQEIQHNLLRMFAFLYTEFVTEKFKQTKNLSPSAQKIVTSGLARLAQQKKMITDALLLDLKARHSPEFERMNDLAKNNRPAFENFAVAESLDSYYCSGKTHDSFKNNFSKTYQFFNANPSLSHDLGKAWHLKAK